MPQKPFGPPIQERVGNGYRSRRPPPNQSAGKFADQTSPLIAFLGGIPGRLGKRGLCFLCEPTRLILRGQPQDVSVSRWAVSQPMVSPTNPDARVALANLHQRSIAVQIMATGRQRLLIGRGVYEHDLELGSVLRIQFPGNQDSEIVLVESTWDGPIAPGAESGVDYVICLE